MVAGTVCAIALAAGITMRARGDAWDKRTILTVNQPIQVTDKVLEPGQYVFKLLDSNSNRHIVEIFNSDQSQLIEMVQAIPNYRLQPTGDSRFAFWETPPGDVRALRAWFYPGDNFGQEFRYPKHPKPVETAAAVRTEQPPPAPTLSAESQVPAEPAPQPQAEQPPPAPEERAETAQNAAPQEQPPAPPPASVSPEVQPETPAELPHTASPYPLIGLAGFAALGLSGLLRRKRSM
jgi:LPXTG-motif cell wall-anchored protein